MVKPVSAERDVAKGLGRQDRRRLGPRGQRLGVHAGGGAADGLRQLLADIEGAGQLPDRGLPIDDDGRRGRARQPPGQRVLTGPGAGERQQLEERAGAEQIEVVGVRMVIVPVALAGGAGAGPAVLDARQAALVETRQRRAAFPCPNHAIVADGQRDERRHGKEQQPGAPRRPPGHDGQRRRRAKDDQARRGEPGVERRRGRKPLAPAGEPGAVFDRGISRHATAGRPRLLESRCSGSARAASVP